MLREESQLPVAKDPYGGRSYSMLREDAGDSDEFVLPRSASDFGRVLRADAEPFLPKASASFVRCAGSNLRPEAGDDGTYRIGDVHPTRAARNEKCQSPAGFGSASGALRAPTIQSRSGIESAELSPVRALRAAEIATGITLPTEVFDEFVEALGSSLGQAR